MTHPREHDQRMNVLATQDVTMQLFPFSKHKRYFRHESSKTGKNVSRSFAARSDKKQSGTATTRQREVCISMGRQPMGKVLSEKCLAGRQVTETESQALSRRQIRHKIPQSPQKKHKRCRSSYGFSQRKIGRGDGFSSSEGRAQLPTRTDRFVD